MEYIFVKFYHINHSTLFIIPKTTIWLNTQIESKPGLRLFHLWFKISNLKRPEMICGNVIENAIFLAEDIFFVTEGL